jgi:hypothetical protein
MTDDLAAHEAGHACAAVVLGADVLTIDMIGNEQYDGVVRHTLDDRYPSNARKRMKIILAGMIESADDADDLPTWPLRRDCSTDEANLADLAHRLRLDQKAYRQIEREALELTLDPEYLRLHAAVVGIAERTPVIDRARLARLIDSNRNRSRAMDQDIDAAQILDREVEIKARRAVADDSDAALVKALNVAHARAKRLYRLETETVEVRTFPIK